MAWWDYGTGLIATMTKQGVLRRKRKLALSLYLCLIVFNSLCVWGLFALVDRQQNWSRHDSVLAIFLGLAYVSFHVGYVVLGRRLRLTSSDMFFWQDKVIGKAGATENDIARFVP